MLDHQIINKRYIRLSPIEPGRQHKNMLRPTLSTPASRGRFPTPARIHPLAPGSTDTDCGEGRDYATFHVLPNHCG